MSMNVEKEVEVTGEPGEKYDRLLKQIYELLVSKYLETGLKH
jgi:hypothetical protein